MYTETITYTDYKGVERTEEFFFDLNESEITEMELSEEGGLSSLIEKVVKAKDTPTLISLFKKLILASYGEISADGRRFAKDPELSKQFTQTKAYNKLFMKLATDEKAAANFINNVIPQEIANKAKATSSEN